ncbi:COPII-coated vesicle component Sec13 [Phakopsora pachyrhizi]|uniref:COPII-coated vesicle component Sec13 n=1 Tax=Phakopsora pachyrhizi TaxID=170000 RepID=A0AAV0APY0_PHAPC|nr:COPII-coated vesicle component Sec13 [Phakopsora pachyrhizi]CAH7671141.1 COPII-coated vesicle component Sec13 [Phakopsora pachyrhizi]
MVASINNASSAHAPLQIETNHEDMIHDAQMDYYGKRLATCSSDKVIKVFDVIDPSAVEPKYQLIDTLKGHDGPVWQISWAHPKFGSILASCSYDGKVVVWRETTNGTSTNNQRQPTTSWEKIKEHTLHSASVNSIAWAPHEYGPILACASSDGRVSVLSFNDDGSWDAPLFTAHPIGCNSISWAPPKAPSSLTSPLNNSNSNSGAPIETKKFATGGCDGLVKIWALNSKTGIWELSESLESGHTDWIRDVAYAPGIGLNRTYLASAGQDRIVNVWTQDGTRGAWKQHMLDPTGCGGNRFSGPVWRLSWSVGGNVLAVTAGDGKVTLWKENLKGRWDCVSEMQQ